MRTCERILAVVVGSALWAACAQHQDGVSAVERTPGAVVMPDANTSITVPSDAGLPTLAPRSDGGVPIYTVTMVDAAAAGFEEGGCGATAVEAKQVVVKEDMVVEDHVDEVQPVALYIVLDQSLSMEIDGLWEPAKDALKSFVNDANSAGIDVALEFFPEDGFDPQAATGCDGTGLDVPAVPMGRLPMNAAAVTQQLDNKVVPVGYGTPIEAALRGGAGFCKQFQQSSGGENCVTVLVTDGAPLGCEPDTGKLVEIAQTLYAGGMGIRTFTVGLDGADFDLLDKLAQAGGAVDCDMNSARFSCDVSSGPSMLGAALQKIRSVVTTVKTRVVTTTHVKETPVDCEWTIPAPSAGQQFDRERVNVQLSAPGLAAPVSFGKVASADACAEKGWHYDNPDAPTRLIACPQTCSLLAATPQARVDILLGCASVMLH